MNVIFSLQQGGQATLAHYRACGGLRNSTLDRMHLTEQQIQGLYVPLLPSQINVQKCMLGILTKDQEVGEHTNKLNEHTRQESLKECMLLRRRCLASDLCIERTGWRLCHDRSTTSFIKFSSALPSCLSWHCCLVVCKPRATACSKLQASCHCLQPMQC